MCAILYMSKRRYLLIQSNAFGVRTVNFWHRQKQDRQFNPLRGCSQ